MRGTLSEREIWENEEQERERQRRLWPQAHHPTLKGKGSKFSLRSLATVIGGGSSHRNHGRGSDDGESIRSSSHLPSPPSTPKPPVSPLVMPDKSMRIGVEENGKGGVTGKAAKLLGEEIVPSGKAGRLLGVMGIDVQAMERARTREYVDEFGSIKCVALLLSRRTSRSAKADWQALQVVSLSPTSSNQLYEHTDTTHSSSSSPSHFRSRDSSPSSPLPTASTATTCSSSRISFERTKNTGPWDDWTGGAIEEIQHLGRIVVVPGFPSPTRQLSLRASIRLPSLPTFNKRCSVIAHQYSVSLHGLFDFVSCHLYSLFAFDSTTNCPSATTVHHLETKRQEE